MAATERIPPALLHDEPMARHTTWRVGGPADLFCRPGSLAELQDFLAGLPDGVPIWFVGLGSNLLVRDGGLRGAVVMTGRALNDVRRLADELVEAGAGVPCTALARRLVRWGLGPAEFLAGIPGTLGGALRMNAGAFGGETWDHVVSVDVIDRGGRVSTRDRGEYQAAYREVSAPEHEWFVAARLRFSAGHGDAAGRMQALLAERQQRQPLGQPSCGSVFRNPPSDHAARLIEAAGLKGLRIGAAEVSPKHANFIINTGGATAADIESLIWTVRDRVRERFGVSLEPEVRIIGEPGTGETAQ
ncbi:MAG: UDP-N-acetylmuramate dehydrogenase [Chromatiales bacterium]|nr:UDP-N-acetylmuramate dehydrogenase [Chromatiales bacterium]